jgi:glutamate synthase (NADPH/NADH) large chain
MTGGTAVILGKIGDNFAAGMTGGMAFVYDPQDGFKHRVNGDSVVYQRLESAHWESVLKSLAQEHVNETGSRYAARLLNDWNRELGHFWQVVPKEMLSRLVHPLSDAPAATVAAGE